MDIKRRNINANGPRRQSSAKQSSSDVFDTSDIEVPVSSKGKVRTVVGKVGNAVGHVAEDATVVAGVGVVATGVAAGASHHAMENVMDKAATTLSDLLTHVMAESATEEQLVKNSMRQTNGKGSVRPLPSFGGGAQNDGRDLDF